MIEFTLSRVMVFVCGVILLASITVPISDIYDSRTETDMLDVADGISSVMDSFWDSEADMLTIRGWDILPSPVYSALLNGHVVTVTDGENDYVSLMSHPCCEMTVSYNQTVCFGKDGDSIGGAQSDENVSAILPNADANLDTSLASL